MKDNRTRDEKDNDSLREAGWSILRFWECEIDDGIQRVVDTIVEALDGEDSTR